MSALAIFPQLRLSTQKQRPERLLLLCYFEHRSIATVPQNISFLQSCSRFEVDVYNFCGCAWPYRLPQSFDLSEYTGIVVHNSLAYNVDNLRELDADLKIRFKDYGGIKVIFKQDENYKARDTAAYLGETQFDVVFTCLPESERQKIYPREVVGDITFTQMLTGYVTPDMREGLLERYAGENRDIDVGYRGSLQPLEFGRLCYEKQTIGRDFLAATDGMSLRCDISSRWEDRFFGDEWLRFLCRCKGVLGVESGASIFDLDGEVARAIEAFDASSEVGKDSPEYPERLLKHLERFEGNVYYNQVSPRHFEAVATKTLQILFEGKYSGILVPDKHFVELKRDFSNIEQVVRILRDDAARTAIVEAAYRDLIAAPSYWIETFVEVFDDVIERQIEIKTWKAPAVRLAPLRTDGMNVLLLCAHHPDRDPRIGWIQRNAPPGMVIHVFGIDPNPEATIDASVDGDPQAGYTVVLKRATDHALALSRILPSGGAEAPGVEEALLLAWVASMASAHVARIFGITAELRVAETSSFAQYLLNVAGPLVESGGRVNGIDAVISCDLDTLVAAVFLKQRFGCPLIYDAHEFWPDSYDHFTPAEFEFWQQFERKLLAHTDEAVTVTRGLADYMSDFYSKPFGCVPNCEPLATLTAMLASEQGDQSPLSTSEGDVAFLQQGQFAEGRGFELLIDAWEQTDKRAKLFLRGPDNAYKKRLMARAAARNLLDRRIFFPEAVREVDLVAAASFADVGIIPYEPKSVNNRHCGPNKLSQYMAAGIAVLSNRLQSVAQVLREGDCGLVADFTNTADLVRQINVLTSDVGLRRRLGENARRHFTDHYNWNVVAAPFYASIAARVKLNGGQQRTHGTSILRAPTPVSALEPAPQPRPTQQARPTQHIGKSWARMLWRLIPSRVRFALAERTRAVLTKALSAL